MELFRSLFALLLLGLVLYGLIIVGIVILPFILLAAGIAFVWYFIKFYRIRKELEKAMNEHREAGGFHEMHFKETREDSGETIEVDYYEVTNEQNPAEPAKSPEKKD